MAKHTPGPWSLSEGWVDKHVSIDAEDHGAIALVLVDMEADYTTSPTKFAAKREELHANARLVAAAPELLDAVLDLKYKLYGNGAANPKIEVLLKRLESIL